MRRSALLGIVSIALIGSGDAQAGFLDIINLTTGTAGSFSGTLDGVAVTGAITANDGSYDFTPTGNTFRTSTIDGTSAQYSYGNIFSPSTPLSDRVGVDKFSSTGSATVTITFATAILNPIFQIANLDGSRINFLLTGGVTGVSLLSGNGGSGDGLGLMGNSAVDLNPGTVEFTSASTAPMTAGGRSAYGSVQLSGSVTTITFTSTTTPVGADDGYNFTLATGATVPEPSSMVLCGVAGLIGMGYRWTRRKRTMI